MRKSSLFPLFLFAAGILQAFPFVIGRPMEYSVIRRGGAERGIVTLLPVDSSQDSGGGSLWTFQITDSLVAGARKIGRDTHTVVTSQLKLHVEGPYMAWTTKACTVPWDVDEPQNNPIIKEGMSWGSEDTMTWGFRALACDDIVRDTGNWTKTSIEEGRNLVRSVWCELGRCQTRSSKYPLPQGLWSMDSGWIVYLDGETRESWVLNRIGNGPALSESRLWLDWKNRGVRRNDIWVFTKVVDWSKPKQPYVRPGDPTSGHDSTWIRWAVLARLGDSGMIGTWRIAREMAGRQSGLDTLAIDFDSPTAYLEAKAPADLSLAVFLRAARPPLALSVSTSSFEWSRDGSNTNYGNEVRSESMSLGRVYSYSSEGDFGKMEQTYHNLVDDKGVGLTLEEDSAITIALRSFERDSSTGTDDSRAEPLAGTPRSLSDLDLLVSRGGQVLSIHDARGVRRDIRGGKPSESLRGVHGVVFLEATTPEGRLFQARMALP